MAVVSAAGRHPDLDFVAVEVYRPGVARTVLEAGRRQLTNLKVLEADAVAVLATALAPGSVREIRVFFPDPWPKSRHHKRRLVQPAMVTAAAAALEPGGTLRMCTDSVEYAQQMLRVGAACPALRNPHAGRESPELAVVGASPRFEGRPVTRFERKALAAGRGVVDVQFSRCEVSP
jgi:tRNA (guanine-N7-)-methyltransferase